MLSPADRFFTAEVKPCPRGIPGSSPLGSCWQDLGPRGRGTIESFEGVVLLIASWRGKIDESHVRMWTGVLPAFSSNGPDQRRHDRGLVYRGDSDVCGMLPHVNTYAWTM